LSELEPMMYDEIAELPGQVIEERLLRQLAWHTVLSFDELKARVAPGAGSAVVRQVLAGLMERGIVVRKPHRRRGLWYQGYARGSASEQGRNDQVPVAFVRLLEQLELSHADW
jgi:hypothetical protein